MDMRNSLAVETLASTDAAVASLQFVSVVRRYTMNRGLGPVSFAVKSGTICSIIGPNGSGKTTLVRAAALFERLDSGAIYLEGQVMSPDADTADRIRGRVLGTVFQHAELWPHLNVRDNVCLPLKRALRHSEAQSKEIADRELEFFGLSDRASAMPDQLSGGMKQRAVLARCLAAPVRILLMDETTSALDPEWTERIHQRLRAFADNGGTVISVSHRLNLVRRMSDCVIYLDSGLIAEQGTPAEVLDNPRTSSLRRFIENA